MSNVPPSSINTHVLIHVHVKQSYLCLTVRTDYTGISVFMPIIDICKTNLTITEIEIQLDNVVADVYRF
jgi:hypothetical protein